MRRALSILGAAAWVASLWAPSARPQAAVYSELSGGAIVGSSGQQVDGVAARIQDDILTESELHELSAFQMLVDGRRKTRSELIGEISDQWIVRGEAAAAKYPEPSPEDVDRAYAQLEKQFQSVEEFQSRYATVGLTEASVRRELREQLYLSRFLDFRFRPAAQIDDQQIADYYKTEFEPQLKKRGEAVPPIENVEDTIREVLVLRAINDRATAWLDDTRKQLKIDVLPESRER
jgi:hypothetical protein